MMSCCLPLVTMLWVLCVLQFMFYMYMASGCAVEERIALMRIKSSLVEANSSYLPDWGHSDDCCSWESVTCNNNARVSDLDLDHMYNHPYTDSTTESQATAGAEDRLCWNMSLAIFSSFHELQLLDLCSNSACLQDFHGLQQLTKLRYLNLSYNRLIGINDIFESLGKIASLEVINIESSSMNGSLQNTAFRNLKNLRELHLGSNRLNGSIPASLFELPRLEYLDLSGNLLQGHIPITSSLNLTLNNLRELNLRYNRLNGSIQASLFELPYLTYLDLSGNLLQGLILISSSANLSSSLQTLQLSENNLNGVFNFLWLWNYTMLKMVDLSRNTDLDIHVNFHGRVPPLQLRALMLSGCKLDNSIIARSNFLDTQRHLRILDLSNNNLVGNVPSWIFTNETTLTYLDLANNLLVGSLDLMWQCHTSLYVIDISMNSFVGQLPMNISVVFPNLTVLDASYNLIYEELPWSLCNISRLQFLDISNNKLTGQVPSCLFTDTTLDLLKLSNNKLGGPILDGISNLSIQEALYLNSNYFEGALPNNLSSSYLGIMDLHDNKLSGKLDVSFWDVPYLQYLSVASNGLTGRIYPTICKLVDLQFLDISDNYFEGSIPNCRGNLTLQFLNMSYNVLSGFPSCFFDSTYLIALDLSYNRFKGNLDWIQHLSQIQLLLLGGNTFGGQISPNMCHLRYLSIIDLSHDRISGSLPHCIGGISFGYHDDNNLDFWSPVYGAGNGFDVVYDNNNDDATAWVWYGSYRPQGFTFVTKGNIYAYGRGFFNLMSGIDLSSNMLSGEIPWEIGNLSHLKSLNLSHNLFTGLIPTTLANISDIESLDLSHNELIGPIPWQLAQLWWLEVFSVAYNNLSGCIPSSGQFGSFGMESYLGNANLHNASMGNSRCSPIAVPVEEEDVPEASEDPILCIISAASFVLAFWATVAFMFCHSFGQPVVFQR